MGLPMGLPGYLRRDDRRNAASSVMPPTRETATPGSGTGAATAREWNAPAAIAEAPPTAPFTASGAVV